MLPNKINLGPGIMNLSGCRLIPSPTDRPLWSLGSDKLTDVSAGLVSYINSSLELQLPFQPKARYGLMVNFGRWEAGKSTRTDPKNVMNWALNGATKLDTLIRVGEFKKVAVTDSGATWNGIRHIVCRHWASVCGTIRIHIV